MTKPGTKSFSEPPVAAEGGQFLSPYLQSFCPVQLSLRWIPRPNLVVVCISSRVNSGELGCINKLQKQVLSPEIKNIPNI